MDKSKILVTALRHKPLEILGINTNEFGYVPVDVVLQQLGIDMQQLQEMHDTNNKRRFQFNEDKTMIRATQGHSIEVSFDLIPTVPPKFLFHRTTNSAWNEIKKSGLNKMNRHHVHLTENKNISKKPVLLMVDTETMYCDGFNFIKTANDVWLTDNVPPKYLKFLEDE